MADYTVNDLTFFDAEGNEVDVAEVEVKSTVRANFDKIERVIHFDGRCTPTYLAEKALREIKLNLNANAGHEAANVADAEAGDRDASDDEVAAAKARLMERAESEGVSFADPRVVDKRKEALAAYNAILNAPDGTFEDALIEAARKGKAELVK